MAVIQLFVYIFIYFLQDQVKYIWKLAEDLLTVGSTATEHRHAALSLMTAVAESANNTETYTDVMRHVVLDYIQDTLTTEANVEPL